MLSLSNDISKHLIPAIYVRSSLSFIHSIEERFANLLHAVGHSTERSAAMQCYINVRLHSSSVPGGTTCLPILFYPVRLLSRSYRQLQPNGRGGGSGRAKDIVRIKKNTDLDAPWQTMRCAMLEALLVLL